METLCVRLVYETLCGEEDLWLLMCTFLLRFSCFGATFAQMADPNEADEIVAAGGIVVDRANAAVRVVLIHRPRYDDWSFPKGKAEPRESISETALREVKEETGLTCRIVGELPAVRYSYTSGKGNIKPKVVHYYLMERVGGRLQAPGQEADAAEWCDPGQAAGKLTYQHDRELLQEALRLDLQNRGGSDG